MSDLEFDRLQGVNLQSSSRRQFMNVRRLADKHRPKHASADQALLGKIMELIGSQSDVASWENGAKGAFIDLSYDVFSTDLNGIISNGPLDPAVISDAAAKADWLCSLSVSNNGSDLTEPTLRACSFWVRSRLLDKFEQVDVASFCKSATTALGTLGVETELLDQQIKIELVLQAAQHPAHSVSASQALEQAKVWCSELLTKPNLRELLYTPAIKLGVEIPTVELAQSSMMDIPPSSEPKSPASVQPKLWILPTLPSEPELALEYDELIFDLLSTKALLSKETSERVDAVSKSTNTKATAQFFFAARDLWQAFVRRGDRAALALMERTALHVYTDGTHSKAPDHRVRGYLRLWMNAQLPQKMLAWPIEDLLKEMVQLFRSAGFTAQASDVEFRESLIEAFAGEAKAREAEGDPAGRKELVEENRISLGELHREYLDRLEKTSRRPSDETLGAWDYLYPLTAQSETASAGPAGRIIDDRDFQTIIRRGGHDDTYEFVCAHAEEVHSLLERRLEVSFGPESLMMPTGKVFNAKGASAKQLDNRFVEARSLLEGDRPNYAQAATIFERLADRLEGRPKDVATDFLAYALARDGVSLKARIKLSELSQNYTFSSAYWNRACSLPAEQSAAQIEILEQGLERAPHPQLLRGLICLALRINDDARLRRWLPCLTFTEALLIHYQLEYAELDDQGKERHILRLGSNALEGEIVLLDPFDASLKGPEIEKMFDRLLRRDQRQALDFWLSCRRLISYNRFDYWELNTNYLERTGAIADAAKSFKEEVRCRLAFLQNSVRAKSKAAAIQAQYLKRRVDKWLEQCRAPDLRATGVSIYNQFVQFASENAEGLRALDIKLTTQERFARYFGDQDDSKSDEGGVIDAAPAGQSLSGGGAGMFESLIARVASDCQSRLHGVSDLPLVREQLDELARAMERRGSRASAQEFRRVLQAWSRYTREATETGRLEAWKEAQDAVRDCEKQFRQELRGQLWDFAQLLLRAVERVTQRLPQNSKLLPKLLVETIDGRPAAVDCEATRSAFALVVRNASDSAAVRIMKATASLEGDSVEFACRDQFEAVPVIIEPQSNVLLTFGTPANFKLVQPGRVTVVIRYEFGGAEYDPGPFSIELTDSRSPSLPSESPYIHSRMIEAYETEGHFFGRESEQKEVLDSVRVGQQRFRYIEGIRHSGKSSLLQSIEYEIGKQGLPLVPIYQPIGSAQSVGSAGGILANIFGRIATHPELAPLGIIAPDEQRCNENMPSAFAGFTKQLSDKLPGRRVFLMVDDTQSLAEAGQAARENNPALFQGLVGLLNLIRENGRPSAPLVWVFAGQVAKSQFRTMMPGVLLWTELRSLPIDFLSNDAAAKIVCEPLRKYEILIPQVTVARIHQHTAGHPEVIQQLSELMLLNAVSEKRAILTPADADEAARDLAAVSDDLFADTWYPAHLLSKEQTKLIADFTSSVRPGGRIELYKLAKDNEVTESLKTAVQDLVTRKILESYEDGTIGVKAYVLDLWLRRWVAKLVGTHQFGAPAIFLDIANLTQGKGTPYVTDLQTGEGEGFPGRYTLATVLDRIERYVRTLSPAMVAVRWAVNYPPGSPAVTEVSKKEYYVKNIPDDFRLKGSDDVVLIEKINEVEQNYPTANHFVLVLGDKDYRLNLERLIKAGKFVHVISREAGMARTYRAYAVRYPEQVTAVSLEELLDSTRAPALN